MRRNPKKLREPWGWWEWWLALVLWAGSLVALVVLVRGCS